jgi:SAM-dependent methyltransferase
MNTAVLVESGREPEWFASWFDSEHYQRLYGHRDDREAALFVDRLVERLGIAGDASILDLGCGNGRHAAGLAARGYQVTGLDLSAASLALARARRGAPVRWIRQDMRQPFGEGAYDYVLNLFTSFGYFENTADHRSVLRNIARALRPGGRAIIDFLNVRYAEEHRKPYEIVRPDVVDSVYRITRWSDARTLFKRIVVEDRTHRTSATFLERVARLTRSDFAGLLSEAGLEIEAEYGDYSLSPFDPSASDRLILVARRPDTKNVDGVPPWRLVASATHQVSGANWTMCSLPLSSITLLRRQPRATNSA